MALDAGTIQVKLSDPEGVFRRGLRVTNERRVNYECQPCGTAYTEQQYNREREPVCGKCGGPIARIELIVVARGSTDPGG